VQASLRHSEAAMTRRYTIQQMRSAGACDGEGAGGRRADDAGCHLGSVVRSQILPTSQWTRGRAKRP
jgi:hypothetical protein